MLANVSYVHSRSEPRPLFSSSALKCNHDPDTQMIHEKLVNKKFEPFLRIR